MILQPRYRPISLDQLIAEVKGIYASLVTIESKCIKVDDAQDSTPLSILTNEQWQAYITLYLTLLFE